MEQLFILTPLIAPVLLFAYAYSVLRFKGTLRYVDVISVAGIAIAVIGSFMVLLNGTMESTLIGWMGLGFSVRLDALSMLMFVMISLLGFVILKFSKNYLDGDRRKTVFFARLSVTIASVQLLVLSGNLFQILVFWIITSICLHNLLVFYRNRPQAVAAARKKFIVARLGDLSLLGSVLLIYTTIGSGDLTLLFNTVKDMEVLSPSLNWAAVLLAIAAILKSAQFPTHGWLLEVVETPTPVSALLHAGLLNAGPFLMVRMAMLMSASISGSLTLIIVGGFTALFASIVYLTQPSVKITLGYSSVAHMGFSLLLCGFGVYAAAILHVVAHSFYKAHSFLSSGSMIDTVRARKVAVPERSGSFFSVLLSMLISLGTYVLFCYFWGITLESDFYLVITGLVIVLGMSQLMTYALGVKSSLKISLVSFAVVLAIATSFFTLESGASYLLASNLPADHSDSDLIAHAAMVVISLFAATIFIQMLAPKLKRSPMIYRLGIHVRNGFYVNVVFDRMIGSLKNEKFRWANLTVEDTPSNESTTDASKLITNETEIA